MLYEVITIHFGELGRQGTGAVKETGADGDRIKGTNGGAVDDLGDDGSDLDTDQGTEQHAHGQSYNFV